MVVALRDAAEPGKVPIPGKPVGAADIEVQAIIVGGDHRRAVVNGRAVSEGQEIAPGIKVEKIERHAVTFDVNGEKVVKQR